MAGPRIGAALYNVAHSYVGPLILAATLLTIGTAAPLALLWVAHIGFDRALGYGLKYSSWFGDTHLGQIGTRNSGRSQFRADWQQQRDVEPFGRQRER